VIALAPGALDTRLLRKPAAAFLAGGLVLAHLPQAWGLPCPLRSLTGVPCPFCGVTTSVRDTLGGHARAGFGAAPVGLALIAVAVVLVLRLGPARIPDVTTRWLRPIVVLGVAAEWCFELHRFHVI
jgi:hypothetical protein